MSTRLLHLLAAGGITLIAATAAAQNRSATLQVSAQVIGRAVVNLASEPQDVVITADDIHRGFVEVTSPLLLNVRTNSRSGYLLRVVNTEPAFAAAEISSADFVMHVASESFIARPYTRLGDALDLKVRLVLAAAAHEGRYRFPLVVDASPQSGA